jgi:hypothetical protein
MASISLGKLTLSADKESVTIAVDGAGVKISPAEVAAVEKFLHRYGPHERRVGFRVPIQPLSEKVRQQFTVRLRKGRSWVEAEPVDVSLTGVLIKGNDAVAAEQSRVVVELRFAGHSCTLIGGVVRNQQDFIAIHFSDTLVDWELEPPEELMAIFHALEQQWLKTRLV